MGKVKISLLQKEFYDKIMDLAFYYKAGQIADDGAELKFEVTYNPAWGSLFINEYSTKFLEVGKCEIKDIRTKMIYLSDELKTKHDIDKLSKMIFPWLNSICDKPIEKENTQNE